MSDAICSICQRPYDGPGNNAQPVNDGRCCNTCNHIIIAARFNKLFYAEKRRQRAGRIENDLLSEAREG